MRALRCALLAAACSPALPRPPRADAGAIDAAAPDAGGGGPAAWTPIATERAPAALRGRLAVWAGADVQELIVWGGIRPAGDRDQGGGRYHPGKDRWRAVPPWIDARSRATLVWTGGEAVLWGGALPAEAGGDCPWRPLASGGRFDPVAGGWTQVSAMGAPAPRAGHAAVWTGSELLVWGGETAGKAEGCGAPLADGGHYRPDFLPPWTGPIARGGPAGPAQGLWTGTEMIVWRPGEGARYDPVNDRWQPMSWQGGPPAGETARAVWTGTEMIVWASDWDGTIGAGAGGRYDPIADRWTPVSDQGAPPGRADFSAVWSGAEVIVWGGLVANGSFLRNGGRYHPTADAWTPTPERGAPAGRALHAAVWTGSEMIVWGGWTGDRWPIDGARYRP